VLRELQEVDFALVDLPAGLRAVCCERDGAVAILIDRRLAPVERLAALAHELVHLERGGSGYKPGIPPRLQALVAMEERRVDVVVADRLVPPMELLTLVDSRSDVEPITAELVADEFGVPPHVAELALRRLAATAAVTASSAP